MIKYIRNTNLVKCDEYLGLVEIAGLGLGNKDLIFLNEVNTFNIRARYPEKKLAFYKKCSPLYTKKNLFKIESLYKDLCQKLK